MQNSKKILLVDEQDEASLLESRGLASRGFEVVGRADDCLKALDISEKLKPDVVFIGLSPASAGETLRAADRIRERLEIPILFTCAIENLHEVFKSIQFCPYGLLVKPYNDEQVISAIETMLAKRKNRPVPAPSEQNMKQALQEKEILLRDIHHRVKNNLQIISSLLDMAGRRLKLPSAQNICRDVQAKVHGMALVHTQLYQSERFESIDIAEYVKKLYLQLSAMFKAVNVTPRFELEQNLRLPIDRAIPCGLILSEILTNIFKHAFADNRKGEARILIRRDNAKILVRLADNGVGIPDNLDPEATNTMGLKLMLNLVRHQLRGDIQIYRDNGTVVSFTFKA